jgi:hypothetical protein
MDCFWESAGLYAEAALYTRLFFLRSSRFQLNPENVLKTPIHLCLFHKKKRKNIYTLQENGVNLLRQDCCECI